MLAALPISFLLAQAEPAPSPAVPDPGVIDAPEAPASVVGFAAGVGVRLGAPARDVPPAAGFSLTTLLGQRYALVGGWLGLGIMASLGYDRYSETVRIGDEAAPGGSTARDVVRGLSVFDFAALQTVSFERGRVRPFLAAGAGLCLSYFNSPEPRYAPGESRATTAVLLGGGGADIALEPDLDLSVRLEYAHLLPRPTFDTEGGERLHPFAHRLAARLGVRYRF